ncbi:hypothetical protein MAC_07426 [Metarhizium acridum CQMa 102]|uniref:Uncharacterized protein n=1 Tax=Metarhizium acridum (strain CQMa 102) TaxID=655827 RepID=E9EC28_METAQ|nr:uncharacterized protein MAC_07426 [Metarhizium acridum CQMa 102]EFY86564.1 hypothetical protein MAC_07426 [Metarhizium acridum CQMa 102]
MQERAAAGGGGLATIPADHVKFVANPASAKDSVTPASENNPAREAHRSVHAALLGVISGGGGQQDPDANERVVLGTIEPGQAFITPSGGRL